MVLPPGGLAEVFLLSAISPPLSGF